VPFGVLLASTTAGFLSVETLIDSVHIVTVGVLEMNDD